MNTDFPRIITLIRKEKSISQKKAAEDLGISQALLSHYEKGIRECGLEFLVRAADYYGVSCDYLLGRSPSPQAVSYSSNTEQTAEEKEKILADSERIILDLCGENDVSNNVSEYLTFCIYKLLRIIYNSDPKNDPNAFRVSIAESEYLSESLICRECAEIRKKCFKNGIRITVSELTKKFTDSHSLLSLIKSTEDKILAL